MVAKPYNGHRSWNAWNVSLWIGNDEGLYRFALECLEKGKRDSRPGYGLLLTPAKRLSKATRLFMAAYGGQKTPDGAKFNGLCVREALAGLME